MFFFAITKAPIAKHFRSHNFKEIYLNSSIASLVIDNFLSKYSATPTGFKIIESPLISSSELVDTIYSEIEYISQKGTFTIYNSVISGRPIYYHINSEGDFLCSTHIHLLKRAGVRIEENLDVLPEFFIYRYVMPPNTLYKNISQLSVGELLKVSPSDGNKSTIVESEGFNPFTSRIDIDTASDDEIAEKTLELLKESIVKLRPVKDKIAVLLSGGLDSSILSKICDDEYSLDSSYSTGYPFENSHENIEKEYAFSAARSFGLDHVYHEASEIDYFQNFIKAISSAEVPIHHLQSVMLYSLFKRGIPAIKNIVLLGEGADSISGSSLHHMFFQSQKIWRKLFSTSLLYQTINLASKITGKGKIFLKTINISRQPFSVSDPDNIVWSLGAYGSKKWVLEYFGVNKEDIIKNRYQNIKKYENESLLDIFTLQGLFGEGYVSQSIWSKLAESQKKIAYYPFYNPELISYLFSIPWKVKLKNPKHIFREVAKKLKIPESIVSRPKSSFGLEVKGWAERGGIFEPLVPLASKVFDNEQIIRLQSSDSKKAMSFWNILNYSIWKRLFIKGEPPGVLIEELNKQFSDKMN
jgi:asparagine synthetase B (glutamine-hydrolysing)